MYEEAGQHAKVWEEGEDCSEKPHGLHSSMASFSPSIPSTLGPRHDLICTFVTDKLGMLSRVLHLPGVFNSNDPHKKQKTPLAL